MLNIVWQSKFKKDYQVAVKRKKDFTKLEFILNELCNERPLPAKNKNHKLKGDYAGSWECHIEPDWLLIYYIFEEELILVRMGTHADLF